MKTLPCRNYVADGKKTAKRFSDGRRISTHPLLTTPLLCCVVFFLPSGFFLFPLLFVLLIAMIRFLLIVSPLVQCRKREAQKHRQNRTSTPPAQPRATYMISAVLRPPSESKEENVYHMCTNKGLFTPSESGSENEKNQRINGKQIFAFAQSEHSLSGSKDSAAILVVKRPAIIAPEENLRNVLHSGEKTHK